MPRRHSVQQEATRRAGRRTRARRGLAAVGSIDGRAIELLGQPAGGGFDSATEVVGEMVEVGHDVLAHDASPLVRRHLVELRGSDQPRYVSHPPEATSEDVLGRVIVSLLSPDVASLERLGTGAPRYSCVTSNIAGFGAIPPPLTNEPPDEIRHFAHGRASRVTL